MTEPTSVQAEVATPAGYYDGLNVPPMLESEDENYIAKLQNNGRIEIRHKGHHVAWVVTTP